MQLYTADKRGLVLNVTKHPSADVQLYIFVLWQYLELQLHFIVLEDPPGLSLSNGGGNPKSKNFFIIYIIFICKYVQIDSFHF